MSRAGTLVDLSWTIETTKPPMPGDLQVNWSVSLATPGMRSRFVLDVPTGYAPHIVERHLDFARTEAEGRRSSRLYLGEAERKAGARRDLCARFIAAGDVAPDRRAAQVDRHRSLVQRPVKGSLRAHARAHEGGGLGGARREDERRYAQCLAQVDRPGSPLRLDRARHRWLPAALSRGDDCHGVR